MTTYYALGQCVQTGLRQSLIKSATVSNGVVSFVGTDFASTNCDANTAGPGLESEGLDTASTACQPSPTKTSFLTATYATALPLPPAGQLAKYSYADAATCSSGALPLQATYFRPQTCSAYYGNAYQQELCAANVTISSSTGGFLIQRFYDSAGCQAAPLVTKFYQLNVCGQMVDTGSFQYVSKALAGAVTVFQRITYTSNDCSGYPTSSSLSGTYYAEYIVSQANTTMICDPTGLNDPGMGFVTVVYAPVLGFSSGWGVGRFSSQAACTTLNTTRLFSGTQYTSGCVKDADTASNFIAVAGCGSGNPTATTVTYTYTFQGVSVATAQSPAFQNTYVLALAAYVGVPASSVAIASVTAVSGGNRRRGRRVLLQSGVNIVVAIQALNNNLAALKNLLANAGPAIVNALAPAFTDLSVLMVPAPAPPTTSWATPGAIAGVVVAGAVALSLIVLLSVFIPRMQSRRGAPVFGPGFAPGQPQQVPPGAFSSSSPQQLETGVQMGVQAVSV